MKTIKNMTVCFALSALLPLAALSQSSDPTYDQTTVTKTGAASPVLSVSTIDGQTVDFHGKVVVLDFFATWCGPCMAEMPHVEKDLWQPLKSQGLILVAVGREHSQSEVQAFQKAKGYTFQFAADPHRDIYGKFATQYIPRCVLIGKDGKIKLQTIGYTQADFDAFIQAVKKELAG